MRCYALIAAITLGLFAGLAGVGSSTGALSVTASPLRLFSAPTPRIRAWRSITSGGYPQVAAPALDLRAVNKALRDAVLADQRMYAPYLRKEREDFRAQPRNVYYFSHGIYATRLDRSLISASTVVVSYLLEVRRQAFEGQRAGDGWVSATTLVPSGERIMLRQLLTRPEVALPAIGHLWRRVLDRRPHYAHCLDGGTGTRSKLNEYRDFALTPSGLAIGYGTYYCGSVAATLPYRAIRRYLNPFGRMLVSGVRKPV